MAYSYNEVTATGSAQLIAVPEYIDTAHIKVSINGVDTNSFTWTNSNTVSVTATAGTTIRVRRESSPGARVVDYMDGTSLTEAVLDADSKQAFFLAQEQLDAPTSANTYAQQAYASAQAAAGYAAVLNPAAYATAAQGTKADSALQPAAIGATVQGYDANTAKLNQAQAFTVSQRGTQTTDNDLSFDLNATNNFKCTPSGGGTLTFTNIASAAGQSGHILLVNGSNYAVAAAGTTKVGSSVLTTISASGTYLLAYYCDGTNVYVTASGALA